MSIDWITIGAQIVNFLVLIWLLKRFLYRPILDGIDAREAEIAARMGEAATIRSAAQSKEAEYKAEIAALSASRASMLAKARQAAEKERDAMLSEARSRLANEHAKRDEDRSAEAQRYTADLHQNGAKAIVDLLGKALSDLADETLEQRIVSHAVTQLDEMADELRAAAGDDRDAVALTRDPLADNVKDQLRRALSAVLPDFTLSFDTDPALSPGLSLRLGGAQVGWTVESYLDGLDRALDDHGVRPGQKAVSDAA